MKAQLEKTLLDGEKSILARRFTVPYFGAPFHFHPEYELTYIVQGSGKRIVGAHIDNFEAGDLIFLGSNVAHYWRSDSAYYQNKGFKSEAIVLHFSVRFAEQILQQIPEFRPVIQLLTAGAHGIRLLPEPVFIQYLEQLVHLQGVKQVCRFLELLESIATHADRQLLNTSANQIKPKEMENDRMTRVLEFTLANFQQEVSLSDVADLANLTVSSFCRYFQKYTSKTYVGYLNEIRVSHARRLLIEGTLSIQEIGMASGFHNLSTFHRLFKQQTGFSPLAYRKELLPKV